MDVFPVKTVSGSALARYLVVGASVNVGLYLLYLAITRFPVIPEVAMTIVYLVGIIAGFFFNRNWSFRSSTAVLPGFLRYTLIYVVGYLLQLGLFFTLYQKMGWPHEAVQAIAIVAVACFIFTCLRFWVFSERAAARP
jgi:putative flippase GtrA